MQVHKREAPAVLCLELLVRANIPEIGEDLPSVRRFSNVSIQKNAKTTDVAHFFARLAVFFEKSASQLAR
jgi:hypothetical protein